MTLGRASRRSDAAGLKKLKAEQSPQVSMFEASQICFDCNACFNCDPHWLFLVPNLWMYESLMYFEHVSRILRILPQFRKLQATVLEFLYFFFEWHDISAGNHVFSFITCNELTSLHHVNGFLCAGPWFGGKLPDYFAAIFIKLIIYVWTVDSIVSILTIYYDFAH